MDQTNIIKKQNQEVPGFVGKRNKRLEQFFRANGYDHHDVNDHQLKHDGFYASRTG